jgi:hypothetical protein
MTHLTKRFMVPKGGRKKEHHKRRICIKIIESRINRTLIEPEEVHHIDSNPKNNQSDNLILTSSSEEHHVLHEIKQKRPDIYLFIIAKFKEAGM